MVENKGLVYPVTEEDLTEYLGEAIHTAFRKATDCDQAHPIWKLIQEMPREDWEAVLDFVALKQDGWGSGITYGLSLVLQQRNNMVSLLQEAHDKMDDYNARHNPEQTVAFCMWCLEEGYDANGLIHQDDCILVRIRKVLE